MSDSATGSAKPPSLLQPPATVISPPSPTDGKGQIFPSPPSQSPMPKSPEPIEEDEVTSEDITYDSPDEEEDEDNDNSHHAQSSNPSSTPRPDNLKSTRSDSWKLSTSPKPDFDLLQPHSANSGSGSRVDTPMTTGSGSGFGSGQGMSGWGSGSRPSSPTPSWSEAGPSTRSPSPSSPHYRPRNLHHRRTSSTARVRETVEAEETRTPDGQRMINQYKIGRSLGRGGYATVELAIDVGTGKEYAIKEFSKSRLHLQALQYKQKHSARRKSQRARGSPKPPDSDGKRKAGNEDGKSSGGSPKPIVDLSETVDSDPLGLIRREIAVMKKLDHPHIVSLFESISVPNADSLFLVLEYMPGGVLMDVKTGQAAKEAEPPFSIDQTREYFRQLTLGLEYLHHNEVIHRDVKPDNILVSANRDIVKLCDFGVSEMFVSQGDDRVRRSGGSPAFLSPESFTGQIHEIHGTAVDIWAFGVTLYCMLTGHLAFDVDHPIDLMKAVQNDQPKVYPEWGEDLQDLVNKMLDKNPDTRIQMDDIRNHAWVTSRGDDPMIPEEDNLYYLGCKVEEPTQEELHGAIRNVRSIFSVVRAIQKFRRLGLHGSSPLQNDSTPSSPAPDHALLLSPESTSRQTGSMDSYASNPLGGGTDSTSMTDSDDLRGFMLSPRRQGTMESAFSAKSGLSGRSDTGDTQKPKESGKPALGLDTSKQEHDAGQKEAEDDEEGEEGVILCDSPTSD